MRTVARMLLILAIAGLFVPSRAWGGRPVGSIGSQTSSFCTQITMGYNTLYQSYASRGLTPPPALIQTFNNAYNRCESQYHPTHQPAYGAIQSAINLMTNAMGGMTAVAASLAQSIFVPLAVIELVWLLSEYLLSPDSGIPFGVLLRQMGILWLVWTLIVEAPALSKGWIAFMVAAAKQVTAAEFSSFQSSADPTIVKGASLMATTTLSADPAAILNMGMVIAGHAIDSISGTGLMMHPAMTIGHTLALALLAVGTLVSFVIVAAELAFLIIESYFVTGMAIILIGFAAFSRFREFAWNWVRINIEVGIRLIVLYAVVALGVAMFDTYEQMTSVPGNDMIEAAFGASVMFLFLAMKLPGKVSAVIGGSLGGGHGGEVAGLAVGAAGLATMAGAALVSGPAGGAVAKAAGKAFGAEAGNATRSAASAVANGMSSAGRTMAKAHQMTGMASQAGPSSGEDIKNLRIKVPPEDQQETQKSGPPPGGAE